MHWRKPFPPPVVRPSVLSELAALLASSFACVDKSASEPSVHEHEAILLDRPQPSE